MDWNHTYSDQENFPRVGDALTEFERIKKKKKTQDPSKARRKGKSFHESGLHEEDKEVKNSIMVQKCKELVKEKVWK